ncbi:MAG: dihydrodipicolinate synthase family protein [Geminicoccaceae bacterium]|nr:dihydrodipicolinate synthase family protein [Geminicoccaceae bacterium]
MPRLDASARGVFIIAATPFTEDGRLDLAATDRLIEFYLEQGVDGMTILGMMGEAPKLTEEEARTFALHVLGRVDARVPVVVGVSAPGFASMRALGSVVMDAGAAGLMVQPPAVSARGDDAVLGYCRMVAETLGEATPWVLQDFPLVASVPMSALLIQRIVAACPNAVMLKHEDWPGLDKLSAVRDAEAEGARRISILTGNGGIFLPFELARGADGAMTGFAYPEMLVEVCRLFARGESEAMLDLFDRYLPLVRYEQQPGLGLAVRKYVLWRRGALACPATRDPAPKLTEASRAELDWLMRRLERSLEHQRKESVA